MGAGVCGGLCNPSVWEAGNWGWFEAEANCCVQVHVEPASALSLASIWTPMNTTGMSPIDMETQEKIKLDRKRQRNRLAASKCRKRKLERISQLDDRVSALKNENADLAAVVKKMKAGVALLKQEVIEHVNSGCDIRVAEGANF